MSRGLSPTSLNEALAALSGGNDAVAVAGCTDLMVVDHATGRRHETVLDLMRVPELQGVRLDGDVLDIGAACTFSEIKHSALVKQHAPTLSEIAGTIGALQIQNRATLGGNIANASPAGDSLPVLLALGAELTLQSSAGERRLAYEQMHLGYRKTALAPGEIITRVRVPVAGAGCFQRVKKVGTREAQAISKVLVAFHAVVSHGVLTQVRIGAGSVAAVPVRLTDAEAVLEGKRVDDALARRAAEAARAQVKPIDDVRSTAPYRHFVLGQVIWRMATEAGAQEVNPVS